MIHKVTYDGNNDESYNLVVDDQNVAEIKTGEDGAIEITEIVRQFFLTYKGCKIVVQNDNDKLGIILDAYEGEENVASETIWFDDFVD
jgi:hypothetical protein